MINFVRKDLKRILRKRGRVSLLGFLILFFFIVVINSLGLISYVFTRTRHLVINLTLALPLWGAFFLYGWHTDVLRICAHIVPVGTPIILSIFIVLIETVRSLIRPITLSVRLTANIIAGHLIITLLSNILERIGGLIYIFVGGILILLLILELAVALIQRYVFVTLCTLYKREIE